jgi:hypothetical protein
MYLMNKPINFLCP